MNKIAAEVCEGGLTLLRNQATRHGVLPEFDAMVFAEAAKRVAALPAQARERQRKRFDELVSAYVRKDTNDRAAACIEATNALIKMTD